MGKWNLSVKLLSEASAWKRKWQNLCVLTCSADTSTKTLRIIDQDLVTSLGLTFQVIIRFLTCKNMWDILPQSECEVLDFQQQGKKHNCLGLYCNTKWDSTIVDKCIKQLSKDWVCPLVAVKVATRRNTGQQKSATLKSQVQMCTWQSLYQHRQCRALDCQIQNHLFKWKKGQLNFSMNLCYRKFGQIFRNKHFMCY